MQNNPVTLSETYLSSDSSTLQAAETYCTGPGIIAVFSRSPPVYEKPNEDRLAVIPVNDESVVLVIADGVGGHSGGETASQIAVQEIQAAVTGALQESGELRSAILTGIENANTSIIATTSGAASTIAVVEINGNTVRTYHAGDSEILITGQRGKVKHQTLSHSPVGYAMESGLMDEGEAIMHEERHIVSNVLGSRDMHITIGSPVKMAAFDTLLAGSDGLFDNLHKQEIIEIIRKDSILACSQSLVQEATGRMLSEQTDHPSKFDDMSFIIFRLNRKKLREKPAPDEKL
jgi:serine/threonine protein phosphatase PrpC